MTPETRELVERLLAKVHKGQFEPGGGTICADGSGTTWGGEKIMELANPDGPKAADLIEAQAARIAELEEASDFYAGRYAERCGQLATAADAERDRIVAWLLEDENEELCTALWAENRRQRKANQFVAYPYLKLFADAIARNAHRDGQERGEG